MRGEFVHRRWQISISVSEKSYEIRSLLLAKRETFEQYSKKIHENVESDVKISIITKAFQVS